MTVRTDPVVLWARAVLVGLLACGLGVAGHVSADGLLPGPGVLVGLGVFLALLAAPMLNRRASMSRLVAMLVAGQTFTHVVLALTAGHRGDPAGFASSKPRTDPGGLVLPSLGGHRVGSLQDAYVTTSHPQPPRVSLPVGHLVADASAHLPMMVAHLVAAAALGVWLGWGERCLWTLIAITAGHLLHLVVPPTPAAEPRPLSRGQRWTSSWAPHWLRGRAAQPVTRRGPPLTQPA